MSQNDAVHSEPDMKQIALYCRSESGKLITYSASIPSFQIIGDILKNQGQLLLQLAAWNPDHIPTLPILGEELNHG